MASRFLEQYFFTAIRIFLRPTAGPILALLGFIAFCSPAAGQPQTTDNHSENDCLVVCIPAGIDSFDPTNYRSRITQIVLKNIFDSLTARDSNNQIIPQLAESWRMINDTYWQFKLRQGIRFHNGHPLSAADVKFTLDRVIGEKPSTGYTSPRKGLLEPIVKVIVEDDRTVGIKTRYPWPNLPLMLSLQEIMPSEHIQTAGAANFEAHPVGTGPFMFVQADPVRETVLKRFEDYFDTKPRTLPDHTKLIHRLIFSVVPSDLERIARLKTGRCDIILNLPPESIPIVEMRPGLRVARTPATRSYFAEINCSRPPLNDYRIRQALNYAVNLEALINHELKGHAVALATVLLPNTFGFDTELHPYPYDLSAARRLLSSAADTDHRPLLVFANHDDLTFAGTIALGITRLGLQAKVVMAPSFRPRTTGTQAPWDIFVGSWGNTTLDPADILTPKFKTGAYGNFSGFASPELDDLMTRAQSTMDGATRIQLYHEIQKFIFKEAPMIFGYAVDEYYGVAERVKHFNPSATGMLELHDVYLDER